MFKFNENYVIILTFSNGGSTVFQGRANQCCTPEVLKICLTAIPENNSKSA
jgi:hypothetical protein